MKQPVVLRVYRENKLETVRQFDFSQIVIGRNSDVQLELSDEGVALLHAMIEERDGDYVLSDLGSATGTFLKGQRILEEKILSGDEIHLGPYRIQFFVGVPKPAAPPKITTHPSNLTPTSISLVDTPQTPPIVLDFPPTSNPVIPDPTPIDESDFDTQSTTKIFTTKPVEPEDLGSKTKITFDKPADKKPSIVPQARKFYGPPAKIEKRAKSHKTFAPPSPYKDLREIIKPQKGSVVEVLVAWNQKILSSKHFSSRGSVFISSDPGADVVVPIISSTSKFELLKIDSQATVCLTQEMTGEVIREGEIITFTDLAKQNKFRNVGSHYEYDLRQGEMLRIGLQDNLVSIYIRYVAETPKALIAPLMDMSSSEVTGVILAIAVSAILSLYMNIYTPAPLVEDENLIEEPIRKATIQFKTVPKAIVEAVDQPVEKKVVEAKDKVKEPVRQSPQPALEKSGDTGKAAAIAPRPNAPPKKDVGSTKSGGAVKTAPKEGAQMKTEKPDPTKSSLLSTFGRGGIRQKLDQAYSGSGELAGMADAATGNAGNAENRAGDDLGSKFKETGSGKGTSTVGIAGVGTQGRGTGTTGYGSGGIGQKGSVQINVGGQEALVDPQMDKEAIRRVIREHIREIRNCYELELQKNPDLYGKLVLEWDIEEEGRVSRTVVKSNALNDKVAQCVMNRLKTWKFPDPPKDRVGRVVYPFVFTSQ